MAIIAPNGNIKNAIDPPLEGEDPVIVYNIYDWDISTIPFVFPFDTYADGFVPKNMVYAQNILDNIQRGFWRSTPLGSAFLTTSFDYLIYRQNKIDEFLSVVDWNLVASTWLLDINTMTDQDKIKILDFDDVLPKSIRCSDEFSTPESIKSTYCRYKEIIGPVGVDNPVFQFIDCGLAEPHEQKWMNESDSLRYRMRFISMIPKLDAPYFPKCDICTRWIVACDPNTLDIIKTLWDDEIYNFNENGDLVYTGFGNDIIVRGKVFDNEKDANKYLEEIKKDVKYFVFKFGNDQSCHPISRLCYENNPEFDPENEDAIVAAGPFDTPEECGQVPTPTPTETPPPTPTPSEPFPPPPTPSLYDTI